MKALFHSYSHACMAVVLIGLAMIPSLAHAAATITIINKDDPGEGFNDPAPFMPVGGNTATTLGQARLNAFQYAANIWGRLISSTVPILVEANMDPLGGGANSATLGGTSPVTAHMNFPGAPRLNTWYVAALANKLSGVDLNPAPSLVVSDSDMDAVFNSDLDGDTVLGTSHWYYGLDGNPPTGNIDFVSTVLHEIGHGLGFLTLVKQSTGQKAKGFDDAFMVFLENHGATPPDYPSMTNAQRVIASTAGPNLHWIGLNVVAARGGHVEMYAPNPAQPGSSVAHFSTTLTPDELMEPFANGPSHNVGLAAQLFADIGWGTIAPELLLDLNATSFTTGDTLVLNATVNQGVPNSLVDVYAARLMPDGTLMFLQPDGVTFSTTIAPVIPNWNVINNFFGPVFTSTFTGTEPPGSYIWFIAFTTPGTLNITALGSAPYSFTPS